MGSRTVLGVYAVTMAVLVAAYFAVPPLQSVTITVLSLAGTAAIVVGVRMYRPQRAGYWLLLAAALVLAGLTRATYEVLPGPEGIAKPGMLLVHVQLAGIVVCLTGGLLGLARRQRSVRDWAAVIDGAILLLGVGLLSWIFIIVPLETGANLGRLPMAVTMTYPLTDVLFATAGVIFVTAVRRSISAALVASGLAAVLVYDSVFWVGNVHNFWIWHSPIDILWIVYFFALGSAALHPSMTTVAPPEGARSSASSVTRLILLASASLIPATVLVFGELHGETRYHELWVVITSAAMLLLVLIRLAGAAYHLRQQSAREHGLREATADLVGAADMGQVEASLDAAVGRLLPAGTPHRVVLATPEDDLLGEHDHPVSTAGLTEVSALPAGIAAKLGNGGRALVYPLGGDAGSHTGLLIIGADQTHALAALRVPAGTLAAAATLALERIRLSGQVIRDASEHYFRALVQNASDVILVLDDDDRIRYASPSAATILGERDLVGVAPQDIIDRKDDVARLLELSRSDAAAAEADWAEIADWTVHDSVGQRALVEISLRDLRDDPSIRARVMTLRDVTEQRHLERELTHRAFHDPLTGLPNRVLFGRRMQDALNQGAKTGGITGVLLIDLDEFKLINDALGHDAGDAYLISVGQRLLDALGAHGSVARLGGDEFAALVVNAADADAVSAIAAHIVEIFSQPIRLNGQVAACGASVGVATTAEPTTSQELLHRADLSLYAAKEAGKGRWRRYEPAMHSTLMRRLELRTSLENALSADALTIDYQPIVTLADGGVAGYEALLRWQHPTRGRLTPTEFIDTAEESGLIVPIGDWVLRTAVGAAARWRKTARERRPYVSVNVSARQFRSPGFVGRVRDALSAAGLPPHLLMLEITERLLLNDDDRIWGDLHELRAMGVRVAIDDFGTGYSALGYLRHVPLDVIKIDRLFTATIASSPQQRALFAGMVDLAHTLGLTVVAEGIETETERALATAAGSTFGQGFLFARPMPDADVRQRLATDDSRLSV